jgi:hypothetical protein
MGKTSGCIVGVLHSGWSTCIYSGCMLNTVANWTGFFGNATPANSGGGCIQDGPFVNCTLSIGPGTGTTHHCIVLNFNSDFASFGNSTQVAFALAKPDFESFRQEIGGAFKPPPYKVHDSGHGMISGEMGNVFSSPGGTPRFSSFMLRSKYFNHSFYLQI